MQLNAHAGCEENRTRGVLSSTQIDVVLLFRHSTNTKVQSSDDHDEQGKAETDRDDHND